MNPLLLIALQWTLAPLLNCISYCLLIEQKAGGEHA